MDKDKSNEPQEKKTIQQLKKFQFFQIEEIKEKRFEGQKSFQELEISQILILQNKFFINSRKEKLIYIIEFNEIQSQNLQQDYSVKQNFKPYSYELQFIDKGQYQDKQYLVTFGSDQDQQRVDHYIKFWEINLQEEGKQEFNQPKFKCIIPSNWKLPFEKFARSFNVEKQMQAYAFGFENGNIAVLKVKDYQKKNIWNQDPDIRIINSIQNKPITKIQFTTNDQNINIICSSDQESWVFKEQSKQPYDLGEKLGILVDVTQQGTIMIANSEVIKEFDIYKQQKLKQELQFDGEKMQFVIMHQKQTQKGSDDLVIIIYDIINNYIAYTSQMKNVHDIQIINNDIYVISLNPNRQNKIWKLIEKDNAFKIEQFFKKSDFDVAHKFAINHNFEKNLQAEICKLHGDHLINNQDLQGAIDKYILTVGYIEPSYVITKFLDVTHIDQLIKYLEAIIDQSKENDHFQTENKHHIALLLNCYVKQKKIDKLEKFLKEMEWEDNDLFDIDAAIKVCRENNKIELAKDLALRRKQYTSYIDILIKDKKSFKEAIDFIRFTTPIEDKTQLIMWFGQELFKFSPQPMLDLIQQMASLSIVTSEIKRKLENNITKEQIVQNLLKFEKISFFYFVKFVNNQDHTDKVILKNFDQYMQVNFKNPDDFLHLFVLNNKELTSFLEFLTNNQFGNFYNNKVIFHKLFEVFLETWTETTQKFQQKLEGEQKKLDIEVIEIENKINKLLKENEKENKFDKNHLVTIFKMFKYSSGYVFLCESLNMTDELLHYYINNNQEQEILQLCKKQGQQDSNLWIQSLKYFIKSENQNLQYIKELLEHIIKVDSISALQVLNIIKVSKNKIKAQQIKLFFFEKLKTDIYQIQLDKQEIKNNREAVKQKRQEYKQLKTQYKLFNQPGTKCTTCGNALSLPSHHFLCGHSFHEGCMTLVHENAEKEMFEDKKECLECKQENALINEKQEANLKKGTNSTQFFEKLESSSEKFIVVTEYLKTGLFNKNDQQNIFQ